MSDIIKFPGKGKMTSETAEGQKYSVASLLKIAGEIKLKSMIVIGVTENDETFTACTPGGVIELLGLLEAAKFDVLFGDDEGDDL